MADEPEHTGGMVALIPADPDQLAVDGGELPGDLHLTLAYLGDDVTTWTDEQRNDVMDAARALADRLGPVEARVFAHAIFNPDGHDDREPCAVYLIGDTDQLRPARDELAGVAAGEQHEPFVPHITAGYGLDVADLSYVGPVLFDRLRIALADDSTDLPLGEREAVMAAANTAEPAPAQVVEDTGDVLRVRFPVLVVEGMDTGDGNHRRYITPGGFGCRPLPLSIAAQPYDPHGGQPAPAAEVCGHITTAERHPGPEVISPSTGEPFPEGVFVWSAAGEIDANHRWANLVRKGYLRGVSVVMGDMDAELIGEEEAALSDNPRRWAVVNSANIACVTLVPVPAFADTHLELVNDNTAMVAAADLPSELHTEPVPAWLSSDLGDEVAAFGDLAVPTPEPEPAMVAAGSPVRPSAWFADPQLDGPTAVTVTDDGRVYGHLAAWDVPHIGMPGQHRTAPRSPSDYAYFRVGAVLCDDGSEVSVGHITMDTGHAGMSLGHGDVTAHYDNTGSVVADVAAGEDTHGIWVAGAVRTDVTDGQVATLRASALSGDWRRIGAGLELVAALAVNTPGFPVPRARIKVGQPVALVAAGVLHPEPSGAVVLDYDTLAAAIASRLRASDADERERAALAAELDDDDSDEERLTALAGLDEGEEFAALAALVSEHADADDASFASLMPAQLQRSYLAGKVAARIAWGTPGDFRRCVVQAKGHGMGRKAEGACNYLHNKAVGFYPGDRRNK